MDKVGIRTIVVNFDDEQLPYLSLVQGDAKTRGFDIVICDSDGKEIPPSDDYIVELVATGSNAPDKPYANRHMIKDGKYRVMIPTEALSKSGFVFLQLVFYQKSTGAVIHTIEQKCPVYRSRGQEVVESNNLYVDITALRLGLERIDELDSRYESMLGEEKIRQDAEKKRNEQEANRIRDEKTRESNETIRKSQELSRKSAEDKRVTAEKEREVNEAQRQKDETSRLKSETQRNQDENTRKDNENKRLSSETERQSNETTRKLQETARQSAEDKRVSSENTRASEEATRKANEVKRESNESTRQSQEAKRITAEKERETKFDGWDKTIQGVIPNATDTEKGVVKISSLTSESEPYTAVSIGKLEEAIAPLLFNSNIPFFEIVDNKFYMRMFAQNIKEMVKITEDEEKMSTLLNSKNVKTLKPYETAIGELIPLQGEFNVVLSSGESLDNANIEYLLAFGDIPIATKLEATDYDDIAYYYDLG